MGISRVMQVMSGSVVTCDPSAKFQDVNALMKFALCRNVVASDETLLESPSSLNSISALISRTFTWLLLILDLLAATEWYSLLDEALPSCF